MMQTNPSIVIELLFILSTVVRNYSWPFEPKHLPSHKLHVIEGRKGRESFVRLKFHDEAKQTKHRVVN